MAAPAPPVPPAALSPAARGIISTALASLTQMAVDNGVALPTALAGVVAPAPAPPPVAAPAPPPAIGLTGHAIIAKFAKYTADTAAAAAKIAVERLPPAPGGGPIGPADAAANDARAALVSCNAAVTQINALVAPIADSDEAQAFAAEAIAYAEVARTMVAIASELASATALFPGGVYTAPGVPAAYITIGPPPVPTVPELVARAAYYASIVKQQADTAHTAATAAPVNRNDALKAAQIARAVSAAARAYVAAVTATAGAAAAGPAEINDTILNAANAAIGATDVAAAEREADLATGAAVAFPSIQFGGKRGRRRTQKNRRVSKTAL